MIQCNGGGGGSEGAGECGRGRHGKGSGDGPAFCVFAETESAMLSRLGAVDRSCFSKFFRSMLSELRSSSSSLTFCLRSVISLDAASVARRSSAVSGAIQ